MISRVMVAHVSCIRVLCGRDTVKSPAVMPPCMALTNDLSTHPETCNVLIQHTLGLNFMPFGSWPILVKRGRLEVSHRFPAHRRGVKSTLFLRGSLSISLVKVPVRSTSPKEAKSRLWVRGPSYLQRLWAQKRRCLRAPRSLFAGRYI
jgi:hypothetical protein